MPDNNVVEMIQAPKMGFTFERTVQVRPYEMAKASIYVQADVPVGATPEQVEKALSDAAFQAKAIVFDQLGLEFSIDEHGVVRELIEKILGPVEVVSTEPKQATKATPAAGVPSSCAGCQGSDFWDNRIDKKNPKGPDFKCKGCGKGVWPAKGGAR